MRLLFSGALHPANNYPLTAGSSPLRQALRPQFGPQFGSITSYFENKTDYDFEQTARPDEMAMIEKAAEIALSLCGLAGRQNARILDVCSGTGLQARWFLGDKRALPYGNYPETVPVSNIAEYVGIDMDPAFLQIAQKRFSNSPVKQTYLEQSILDPNPTTLRPNSFDVILGASAYHHMPDDQKVKFLKTLKGYLKPGGRIVLADNYLNTYTTPQQRADNIRAFYRVVKENTFNTYWSMSPQDRQKLTQGIDHIVDCDIRGEHEYKVPPQTFRQHAQQAGLRIIEEYKVWPDKNSLYNQELGQAGNYVFVLQKAA